MDHSDQRDLQLLEVVNYLQSKPSWVVEDEVVEALEIEPNLYYDMVEELVRRRFVQSLITMSGIQVRAL